MTKQEIQDKLSAIRKNNALPEKQKGMLLDKYERMLVDATMFDPDSGKITKAPRAPRAPKAPATAQVKPGMGEPDCDDLFEADKMRKARAAEAAEKRKNAPKKTEATKNTEAVEKASSKVEKSVEKRIKSGDVSVAEIKKIIDEYETALKKLRQLLTRAEGKMKYGGPVKDDEIGKLLDKANDIRDHHCECSGDKYAKGGLTEHGLEIGDTIVYNARPSNVIKVNAQDGEEYWVNLNLGKRMMTSEHTMSNVEKNKDFFKMSDGGSMYSDGGTLEKGAINYLGDLWFAIQERKSGEYSKLAENLDRLHVSFSIQNAISSDAESMRGRKAISTEEAQQRIRKILKDHGITKFDQGGSMYAGGGESGKKVYYEMPGIGSAKYTVNFHDGKNKHSDGSPFFDIRTFKSKMAMQKFINDLQKEGYSNKYEGGGESGKMPSLKIVYPTKKSIARPVSKLMDDLNVDYSSIDFYDTEDGFEAAIIDLNKQKNGAEILSKFEAFEEKHRGDFWLIKLKADGSMYAGGGDVHKSTWIAVYQKGNGQNIVVVEARSKDEAIREAEMSKSHFGVGKDSELIDIYISENSKSMSTGGSMPKGWKHKSKK